MALAEMAFAGGLGATIELDSVPAEGMLNDEITLFPIE